MTGDLTFKEMFDELRRLEDCVLYFEQRVLRQKIALEEYARVSEARCEETTNRAQPAAQPPNGTRSWRQRVLARNISDEAIDEALKATNGNRPMAALRLGCSTGTLYNRRPVKGRTVTE